jgi:peptide/nickel transport system permease protein
MFFGVILGWFPTGHRLDPEFQRVIDFGEGWTAVTNLYTVDSLINGRLDIFVNAMRHLVLPVVTLSYISWAVLVRVTRSSMLETLRTDYVRTARAKGVRERLVIQKHARPNAMLPVVTIGGAILVGLLNGVVITETIFVWPGMGSAYIAAASNLDIVTLLGLTLFGGTILILGNLAVDFMYAYLDPRVRLN